MLSNAYLQKQRIYGGFGTSQDFASTDGNTTITADKAGHTQYVQRIVVTIKTSAAQTITFQDSAGTEYVCKLPASPGVDTRWDFDFGPKGKALAAGKGLQMAMTAGNAGHVQVYGYTV